MDELIVRIDFPVRLRAGKPFHNRVRALNHNSQEVGDTTDIGNGVFNGIQQFQAAGRLCAELHFGGTGA